MNKEECKHFKAWYKSRPNGFGGITIENYCYLYGDNCEKHPQCLYRSNQLQQLETQLKRKEQECEELKKINNTPNNETWKTMSITFDNGTAKTEVADMSMAEYSQLKLENTKLKQTLTEIKEIAEWHTTSSDSEDVQEDMKQILQKISEVNNDR